MLLNTGVEPATTPDLASPAADPVHASAARQALYRIKLRFNNPHDSTKESDEEFLKSLEDLIDLSKLGAAQLGARSEWDIKANYCIDKGRQVLKKEWETTKKPWKRWFAPLRSLREWIVVRR